MLLYSASFILLALTEGTPMSLATYLQTMYPDRRIIECAIPGISDESMQAMRDFAFAQSHLITMNDTEGFGPEDAYGGSPIRIAVPDAHIETPVLIEIGGVGIWVLMSFPSAFEMTDPNGFDMISDIAVSSSDNEIFRVADIVLHELYAERVRSAENLKAWAETVGDVPATEIYISCRGGATQVCALTKFMASV